MDRYLPWKVETGVPKKYKLYLNPQKTSHLKTGVWRPKIMVGELVLGAVLGEKARIIAPFRPGPPSKDLRAGQGPCQHALKGPGLLTHLSMGKKNRHPPYSKYLFF